MDFLAVPCSLAIEHKFNPTTRKLTGAVKVTFEDGVQSGNYKLLLYVIEDSVVYKQYEYGMSQDFGVPYVEPSKGYLDNWYHNHVLRDGIITGDSLWGEALASNPESGAAFTVDFSDSIPNRYPFSGPGKITIPAPYDPEKVQDEQVSLLAIVTRNDSEVVNSSVKRLDDTLTTAIVEPFETPENALSVTVCNRIIHLSHCPKSVTASLLTLNGRVVARLAGERINGIQLFRGAERISKGVYLLNISSKEGGTVLTKRITLQ